jgi:signal transduction histidine kinase
VNGSRATIRRKLVTLTMLTSTVALVLAGGAIILYNAKSFRTSLVAGMNTRAAILAANSTAALVFDNPEDAKQVLAALKSDPRTVAAALYDAHGRLFASYPAKPPKDAIPPTPLPEGNLFESSSIVVTQPVMVEGRKLGTISVRSDLRQLWSRQRMDAFVVLLAVLASLGVTFALSTWLQRGITRPIKALGEAARRVSEERDYSVRAEVMSRDEVGVLTQAFNGMLQEIQGRDREIRKLNADLERRVALRTAELESTNRELEAFTYSVSHDLRAPVRHISGFSDLLLRRSGAQLDELGTRYVNNIVESAGRMGNLIDDLLSFSRMGRQELQATTLELDQLVAEVIHDLEPETQGRTIHWQVGELPVVHADPAMLRQVLTNLLSNAVKYSAPRAEARIEVSAEDVAGETIVSVRDNGVGFEMAYVAKLFGVFQRLHGADEFEGTGIGLANVRRIVHRHGGRTWAEGEVDRGATFHFSLPRLAEAA